MSKTLRCTVLWGILGATAFAWAPGCSSDNSSPAPSGSTGSTGSTGSSTGSTGQTGSAGSGSTGTSTGTSTGSTTGTSGGADAAPNYTYTLIDDMETTNHGPIEYAGIMPPETPAYWFNFGGTKTGDTMTPPYQSFAFSAIDPPHTTYMNTMSAHGAHQVCALNGQYDVCGIGVEFAQINDEDAGADAGCIVEPLDAAVSSSSSDASSNSDAAISDASTHDATVSDASAPVSDASSSTSDGASGEAGLPVCKVTVPFDISQYKGVAFWAKADLGDASEVDLKVIFPDPDSDPRGGICNSTAAGAGGSMDLSQCYDSYAKTVQMSGDWKEYEVLFSDLALGTFGWVTPNPFDAKHVYGINFQTQDNAADGSPTENFDFWIDDLYFIK